MRARAAPSAALGAATAALALGPALRARPARLLRTNVNGRAVAATLGGPLCAGALAGAATAAALDGPEGARRRTALATAGVAAIMGAAGLVDDLGGAEAARGFRGHLAAAAAGRLTGGLVKIGGGALAGLGAGLVTSRRPAGVALTALTVPLAANLVNLLDRAPGRAGKASLSLGVPLVVWGAPAWRRSAAGTVASLLVCLPADLSERAMLGDAGANAAGAVLGLGLALSLPPPALGACAALLAAANLASEHVSFSAVIERNRILRAIDRWGRRDHRPEGSERGLRRSANQRGVPPGVLR